MVHATQRMAAAPVRPRGGGDRRHHTLSSRCDTGSPPPRGRTGEEPPPDPLLARALRLLGQQPPQPVAYLVRLLRRPAAKTLAGFHAELAGFHLLAQERTWTRAAIEIGHQYLTDVEGEIEPDQIGLLHR